jgi:hypothetical protein
LIFAQLTIFWDRIAVLFACPTDLLPADRLFMGSATALPVVFAFTILAIDWHFFVGLFDVMAGRIDLRILVEDTTDFEFSACGSKDLRFFLVGTFVSSV